MNQEEYESRLSGARFANSGISKEEVLEGYEFVKRCSIAVNIDLPFALARSFCSDSVAAASDIETLLMIK